AAVSDLGDPAQYLDRCHVVERAEFVVGAPAAPVARRVLEELGEANLGRDVSHVVVRFQLARKRDAWLWPTVPPQASKSGLSRHARYSGVSCQRLYGVSAQD